jgi:hypothetical protein
MPEEDERRLAIKDLYPEFEQQTEAEYQLKGYMQAIWDIYQRRMHIPEDDLLSQAVDKLLQKSLYCILGGAFIYKNQGCYLVS